MIFQFSVFFLRAPKYQTVIGNVFNRRILLSSKYFSKNSRYSLDLPYSKKYYMNIVTGCYFQQSVACLFPVELRDFLTGEYGKMKKITSARQQDAHGSPQAPGISFADALLTITEAHQTFFTKIDRDVCVFEK